MPRIVSLRPITSITVGPGSTILPDGTILNPVPYSAVDITFDDGVQAQVERPLTVASIQAAWRAAVAAQRRAIDGIATGDNIVVP